MKKFTIMALAVCLTVVMAAPVMAVDVDFSGDYRARGFYTEHWDLDKDTATDAYMDMRFRLQTVFKATDNLSVTTRFDGLEKVWGGDNEKTEFDRAYMTIKTDFGDFYVGRMIAGVWGTSFLDSEGDGDRIKYIKKIDNLTLYAVYQKTTEGDDTTSLGDAADQDSDTYCLLGKYEMENVTAGLQLAFANDKTFDDRTTHKYNAIPYFVSKFGPLEVQGELSYNWGETERDPVGGVAQADIDIKQLAYNLEATYNFGPASVMAGYAFVSGDNQDPLDNEESAYGGVGDDWEKLFILTYAEAPVQNLGGQGNLSGVGNNYGAKIFYGGATFSPLENLELGLVVGHADADEIPVGMTKDDYGIEYDFTLNWQIYDNLSYSAVAAFLSAGDFYWNAPAGARTTEPATFEDTYALFHQIQLSF